MKSKSKENKEKVLLKGKKSGRVTKQKITTIPQIGSLEDDQNKTYHEY